MVYGSKPPTTKGVLDFTSFTVSESISVEYDWAARTRSWKFGSVGVLEAVKAADLTWF